MSVGIEDARLGTDLEVTVAPFWRRLLADLIDLALLVFLGLLLWSAGVLTPGSLPEMRFDWIDYAADLIANHRFTFYPFFAMCACLGATLVLSSRAIIGASLGERVMGLALVDRSGEPAKISRGAVHLLGTWLGLVFLLQGYVWAAVDKNRQGVANYLSGTLLIVVPADD